jgi:hypothetical protein
MEGGIVIRPDDIIAEHASIRIVQLGARDWRIKLILDGEFEILDPNGFETEQKAFEALVDRIDCIGPEQIIRVQ